MKLINLRLTEQQIKLICHVIQYANYTCTTDRFSHMSELYGKAVTAEILDKLWNILYGEKLNLTGEKQDD